MSAKRLASTLRCDVRLQLRNGFYHATAFVTVVWALVLSQLSEERTGLDLASLLPVFVLDGMLIGTFYFMAGLVLLEKGEGTLEAQVVSPLRAGEYLVSKIVTLTLLALAQFLVVTGVFHGLDPGTLLLAVGIALASAMYVLVGFISVARYASIGEYLFPSLPYAGMLLLPLAAYVLGPDHWAAYLAYLHPLQGPLEVMRAAFQPVEAWQLAYGLLYSALWIALLYRLSLRAFARFVISRAGAS